MGIEPLALESTEQLARSFIDPMRDPPAEPGVFPLRSGIRTELLELFIDYFCRENPIFLKHLMDSIEKCIIMKVLTKVQGNQKEAAKVLGIKYTTLNQKIKKYGIRFRRGVRLLDS